MLIVRVELLSAITGQTTELARMHVANDGAGTAQRGNYNGTTFTGRDKKALDCAVALEKVTRRGRVENYPRLQKHVWNLVARMLMNMGYA